MVSTSSAVVTSNPSLSATTTSATPFSFDSCNEPQQLLAQLQLITQQRMQQQQQHQQQQNNYHGLGKQQQPQQENGRMAAASTLDPQVSSATSSSSVSDGFLPPSKIQQQQHQMNGVAGGANSLQPLAVTLIKAAAGTVTATTTTRTETTNSNIFNSGGNKNNNIPHGNDASGLSATTASAAPLSSSSFLPSSNSSSSSNNNGIIIDNNNNLSNGDNFTNLIINYLPQNMGQEEVRVLFCSIGEVESCKLIRDKATGQSLGYAFVNYFRHEHAQRALQSFNGLRLQNKMIKVSIARPSNDSIKGANLYVSGLPKALSQSELESVFRPYGNIVTSRILFDNATGLSKGVGFVRFDTKQEAEIAIEKLNGTTQFSGGEPITVKFANNPATNTTSKSPSSSTANVAQIASSFLPLQMLQSTITSPAMFVNAAAAAAPILNALPSVAQQTLGGGPIHNHQAVANRLRYSPLAGNPLVNGLSSPANAVSIPTSLSSAAALGLTGFNPATTNLLVSGLFGGTSAAAPAATEYTSADALIQLQQLQQQLALQQACASTANSFNNYPSATNPCSSLATAQQIAAYAAALSGIGGAAVCGQLPNVATIAGYSGVGGASASSVVPVAGQQMTVGPQATCYGGSAGTSGGVDLFVYNLAPETDEPTLWQLFGPFGAVRAVQTARDQPTDKCKGYGFVTMANINEAIAAITALNGYQLGSRTIQVSLKSPQLSMMNSMAAR